ncbi:MAG: hypothetical protein Q9197_004987 [Variospora fuerteventurae]
MARYDNNNKNAAIPGTIESHEHIAEVDQSMLASHDNNNQNVAIPGTIGTHDFTTEVEQSGMVSCDDGNNNNKNAAIPGTIGAQDHTTEVKQISHDNNGKSVAIPGTVGALEQTTEINNAQANGSTRVGVLHLRGDCLNPELTPAQCTAYKTDGYLVIPEAITSDEADKLLNEAHHLMKRVSEGGEGIIRHSVSTNGEDVPSPIGRILATFEPGPGPDDKSASNPFERRVARLGCGVHKLRPFHLLTHSAFNRSIARALGYADARLTQSQLIAKLAGIGGEIVPHQDGCVSFTDPPSALTFWYALEDTTLDNGCLCVAAGSHLTEPIRQRLVKQEDGRPKFEDLTTPLWARGAQVPADTPPVKEYKYQALEVKKGTLVLFHGNVMHKSGTNRSEKNRISYNFNVIDGSADCLDGTYLKPANGEYERL